jgi:hypothetical protein
MKLILITLVSLVTAGSFAQQKSTGILPLNTNMTASFTLNSATSQVTLTLTGPNDRWFALQFGSFSLGGGMQAGTDVVYWNNTTLVDAVQNGIGVTPTADAVNNWNLVSNTNNAPATGLRTLVCTRSFSTGDANDYTFAYSNNTIDLVWARAGSAGFSLAYHGGSNRGYLIDASLSTLGVADFTITAATISPNPSHGFALVHSPVLLKKIEVFSQTGTLLKTLLNTGASTDFPVDTAEFSSGVYLLHLYADGTSTWKRIAIE